MTTDAGELEARAKTPALTFTPHEGWELAGKIGDQTVCHSVWFYTSPVDADQSFTLLFSEWNMPYFRVRSGVCGERTYTEIVEETNEAIVTRSSLQVVMERSPGVVENGEVKGSLHNRSCLHSQDTAGSKLGHSLDRTAPTEVLLSLVGAVVLSL